MDYESVNYFTDPLDEKKLRQLLKKAGIGPFSVLRKRDKVFKENKLTEDTPDDELFRLLAEHPSLLERPIVEYGNKAVVARPIDKAIALVNEG
ncbi:MAG: arsenate reductase [Pyrinomonadaceae bacterium]|nr:arsenate reductase [Pyrinomonadaceae bacterium]